MKLIRLKFTRMELGVTQKEIAGAIGMSVKSYSFKETGKAEFSRSDIAKITTFLKLTPEKAWQIFFVG